MGEVAFSSEVVFEEEEVEEKKLVRWESLLPRMSLGVLLVEGDDSTRQIIAALLRKCNYKVAAVTDGLKAWETLKERPTSIDLVLTEVDLPSVSGFSLLTMIMGHETCKNIPVIMMSSHDSISVVFKCMLGGAADFLVKPIRKNELRNLWQHVWRRQASNGLRHGHKDRNLVPQKINTISDNNAASNHSSACMQKNRECSEKGSDAQSSCTKPDTEAESAYVQKTPEILQPKCMNASPVINAQVQKHDKRLKFGGSWLIHESEAEDKSMRLGSEVSPCNQEMNPNEMIVLEKPASARVVPGDEEVALPGYMEDANMVNESDYCNKLMKPSREAIDFFGVINNQQRCSYRHADSTIRGGNMFTGVENLSVPNGSKFQLSHLPQLELSLRSAEPSGCKNQETEERHTMNHSNDSPFSRYNNKTLQPAGPVLSPTGFSIEPLECSRNSQNLLPNQSPRDGNGIQWHGLSQNKVPEEIKPQVNGPSGQEKTTFPFPPLGVVPVPVASGGMPFDSFYASYGAFLPPIFYPQSHPPGPPPWTASSSSQQEVVHVNSSHQSNPESHDSDQNHHPHDQIADKPICWSVPEQEPNFEPEQEPGHVLSAGQSGSSNVCNGSRDNLNSSGCGSVCNGSSVNGAAAAAMGGATSESGNDEGLTTHDGIRVKDYQRISQREAALTKFRLKRKDRCFEKKVRYQSRKRLAEQRPRVKGQFVRQVQHDPHPQSMDLDGYHGDSFDA